MNNYLLGITVFLILIRLIKIPKIIKKILANSGLYLVLINFFAALCSENNPVH